MGQRKFNIKHLKFIKENYHRMTAKFIAQCLGVDISLVKNAVHQYGLKKAKNTGQYHKGAEPWNKGMKYETSVSPDTEFKKGHRPHNTKEIGAERIGKGNIIQVKVAEPNKWISKHKHIYQTQFGEIEKGSVVVFKDGNTRNFNHGNLECITRAELLKRNRAKNGKSKNAVHQPSI